MNTSRWSAARVAEQVLAELHRVATRDRYAGCTTRGMAERLGVSQATTSRALTRLVDTEALRVVEPGTRSAPTVYQVIRKPDLLLLRDDIRAIA